MDNFHALQTLIDDLWWRSEADEPWHLARWCWTEPPSPEAIRRHLRLSLPEKSLDLETFFHNAITPQAWDGPREIQARERHQKLLIALQQQLVSHVHLFGEVTRTVVIAIPIKPGDWAILTTVQVET